MNLIKRSTQTTPLDAFRTTQYNRIPEMIINGANYLINLGMEYDPKLYDGTIDSLKMTDDLVYTRIKHFATTRVSLKHIDEKNTFFVSMSIPDLIHGTFFQLNSVHYVPMYYITDEPIVLKEKSISIYSLFQPITLYFEQNRVIFMGINILMSDFLQLMTVGWPDEAVKMIESELKIDLNANSLETIIKHLSQKLNCGQTVQEIKNKINLLFFDGWTHDLYRQFYDFDPIIDNVLKVALHRKIEGKKPSFIDLRHKRLAFVEPLMRPFTKAVGDAAKGLLKGNSVKSLKLNLGVLVNHFFKDLDGNVLYDTTNGFSGILAYKASFKNPYGESKLPREVSSIHWTHQGRICPNSIANNDPGETICLVPDQEIDLQYGIFKFSKEELMREDNNITCS